MITIDTNEAESFMYEYLTSNQYPTERKRLDVGDVMISSDDRKIVLERKTWTDMSASLCDGRWHEQKSRMLNEDGTTKFGYVIEGHILDWNSHSFHCINSNAMWGALIKTQIRDDMYVFHTVDKNATCLLLKYLYENLVKGEFKIKEAKIVTGTNKRKKNNLQDHDNLYKAMLCTIPGVSKKKADSICIKYPSIKCLLSADKNELSEINCDGRKLGPAVSTTIMDFLNFKNDKDSCDGSVQA